MSTQSTFIDTKKFTKSGNKFGMSGRVVFDTSKEFTPGPGAYKASSSFGYYVNRNAVASKSIGLPKYKGYINPKLISSLNLNQYIQQKTDAFNKRGKKIASLGRR